MKIDDGVFYHIVYRREVQLQGVAMIVLMMASRSLPLRVAFYILLHMILTACDDRVGFTNPVNTMSWNQTQVVIDESDFPANSHTRYGTCMYLAHTSEMMLG